MPVTSTGRLGSATVNRVGFGAMQLPGPGVIGPPRDHDEAIAVLKRAVEAGVDHIDTAWYYGPHVANPLIREALAPYGEELKVVTKLGGMRTDDGGWGPAQRPEELKEGLETDLRELGVDHVHASNLRLMDEHVPEAERVPLADQLGAMVELREAGKLSHIGLSTCTVEQLDEALEITEIACVQNAYNVGDRADEPVLERCAERGIAYVPYFPVGSGFHHGQDQPSLRDHPVLLGVAGRHGATSTQVALAWLLQRDEHVLLIPGTSSLGHLEENLEAGSLELTDQDLVELDALSSPAGA